MCCTIRTNNHYPLHVEFPLCVLFLLLDRILTFTFFAGNPNFPPKETMMTVKAGEACLSKFCIIMLYRYCTFSLTDRTTQPSKITFHQALNTCILVNKISCRPFFIDVLIFMQAFVEKTQNFPLRTCFLTNI